MRPASPAAGRRMPRSTLFLPDYSSFALFTSMPHMRRDFCIVQVRIVLETDIQWHHCMK